ncbi:protein-arginine omega-N asymmetric methyltransferase [Desmophyllum pertusum]|uniref:Protein-arginine omega-N asymmetric methyltransferase n=1 Tax=Desmophyllum pertusum TaxID=174260 RepID=A0A9W9Y864_9CNID|nr:protein-arginine omega-N asymmetric methyltransferase [Desmophyllum pertusum]
MAVKCKVVHCKPCTAKKVYEESVTVWANQYGFDFSPILSRAKAEFLARPLHNYELDPEDCLSQSAVLLDIDMSTFSRKNLEFISEKFEFVITKGGTFHGLCAWFSVDILVEYLQQIYQSM